MAYSEEDFIKAFPSRKRVRAKTIPMSEDWKKGNKKMWWDSNNHYDTDDSIKALTTSRDPMFLDAIKLSIALRDKLLSLGGEEACMAFTDPDHIKILERGILFRGKSVSMKGRPSQCHQNSCDLWETDPDNLRICTGYALSRDGLWREHSWLVQLYDVKGETQGVVIETTLKRIAYFGYIMTKEECERFVSENW